MRRAPEAETCRPGGKASRSGLARSRWVAQEGDHNDLVLAVALAAWWREWNHARIEQQNARHYGRAEEPSGPGRLLPNGLRTVG